MKLDAGCPASFPASGYVMTPGHFRRAMGAVCGRAKSLGPEVRKLAQEAGYLRDNVITSSGAHVLDNAARGRPLKADARRAQITVYTTDEIDRWAGIRAAALGLSKGAFIHRVLMGVRASAKCITCFRDFAEDADQKACITGEPHIWGGP